MSQQLFLTLLISLLMISPLFLVLFVVLWRYVKDVE